VPSRAMREAVNAWARDRGLAAPWADDGTFTDPTAGGWVVALPARGYAKDAEGAEFTFHSATAYVWPLGAWTAANGVARASGGQVVDVRKVSWASDPEGRAERGGGRE